MTDTLPRPSRSSRPAASRRGARPGLLRAGLPAAGWALGAGLLGLAVPVLLVWAADSRTGAGTGAALRAVLAVWLLAHGAALHVPGGVVGLVPLGLLALPVLLVERAARLAAAQHEVRRLGDAARLAAGVAGPYALGLTAVSVLARSAAVQPDPVGALVGASVLGLGAAGLGVVRGAGLAPVLRARVPQRLRQVATPAAAAAAALLGAGALLVGLQLAVHLPRAADLAVATSPGLVGGLGLLLLGLLLVPTAAVWGVAYLAGPGVAVGTGSAYGPFAVHAGGVPGLPLAAALPSGPLPLVLALLAVALPVAAGVLAARLARRSRGSTRDALLAAPLVGGALGLLAALSGGPLGDGRLAAVGPSAWRVALALTVEVAAGVLAHAGLLRLRGLRRRSA